ncbi:MAG: hypothetical protein U1E23_09530 [Reyranellaceae bacterium]
MCGDPAWREPASDGEPADLTQSGGWRMRNTVRFEVTAAETDPAARRLTTAAAVAATMEDSVDQATLEAYIDEVSAKAAVHCRLAKDGINPPTFAEEECRATFYVASCHRGERLILPWRVGITIDSVTENGVALVAGTDFDLLAGGILLRLCSDAPACWSQAKIVVDYTAGWTLPTGAPADLQAAIAEQVKYRTMLIDVNPSIRQEAEPDVYSAQYNVPGGDSIDDTGLLVQVVRALGEYRSPIPL